MVKNKKSAYCRTAFTLLACLLASQVSAQGHKIIKAGKTAGNVAAKINENIIKRAIQHQHPAVGEFTNASGVLLNPKGEKHSTYPSGAAILGSPKVLRPSPYNVTPVSVQPAILSASERVRWRELFEKFNSLAYQSPTPISGLVRYLRHTVPQATFAHIQAQYTELADKIELAKERVSTHIIYASLPGEGKILPPEEIGEISETIYPLITRIRELRTALPDDPFLKKQQEAWEQAFNTFNPLLGSLMTSSAHQGFRRDKRELVSREFDLLNPDGTDYLLPRSETLLVDPDELDEMDSYAAVREKMRNPPIKPEDAAAERAVLLDQIPSGMRIALINDDTLPRVNFQGWARAGYLGHNATIDTFADGDGFMENVRKGVRYDLVITDLLVPNGGIAMIPKFRILDTKAVVIASSKFDRGEEDRDKLFNMGFDGYLWYNTNLNEGAYGYIEYLRAMKNYFYYKYLHGWQR